jgi:hypothetical protein
LMNYGTIKGQIQDIKCMVHCQNLHPFSGKS